MTKEKALAATHSHEHEPVETGFFAGRLLYRDGLILVVDKPAGYVVHAKPGTAAGPSVLEHYFCELQFGLPNRPALAHRLDRDTTGCLILGRHAKALRRVGQLLQTGKITKTYWTLCRGVAEARSGTIDSPLVKRNQRGSWRIELANEIDIDAGCAKAAATTYRTLAANDGMSLLECRPKTGRTHQLRVHLASIGLPILGDPKYGNLIATDRVGPIMLHARALTIPLYPNKAPIRVAAPVPDLMARLVRDLAPDLLDTDD